MMDYDTESKKSQNSKGSKKCGVLIPECGNKNEDSPADVLESMVPRKDQKNYTITEYVNDINRENAEVLLELKTDGTTNAAYTYGYDRVSQTTERDTSYYLYDGRGSVAALTSETGNVTSSYQYDPYGTLVAGMPISINYYGYNAESTNTNTGLQYLRARYYSSTNGVFITEDTYPGTKTEPLTRNRYVYVVNNPLNYIDPTGHNPRKYLRQNSSTKTTATSKTTTSKTTTTKKTTPTNYALLREITSPAAIVEYKTAQAIGKITNNTSQTTSSGAYTSKAAIFNRSRGFGLDTSTYTSFDNYAAARTAQIRENISRELCETGNEIKEWASDVDWKKVGTYVAIGASIAAGFFTMGAGFGLAAAIGVSSGVASGVMAVTVSSFFAGGTYAAVESTFEGNSTKEVLHDATVGGLIDASISLGLGALGPVTGKYVGKAILKIAPNLASKLGIEVASETAEAVVKGSTEPGTLSNVDARKWYLEQEAKIPDLIDDSLPLEQQARQAFDLRNQYRTQARELMSDRQLAESLYATDPNLTWEQIIQKQIDKGLSGDDIYKAIIESSQRSRTSVNQSLGLE